MVTLSAAIVRRQAASSQAVEKAVNRQVLQGGDLVTNLLELGALGERAIVEVLADFYDLVAAPIGELPAADASTVRLVPADLALRHEIVPLAEADGTLTVAVSQPLDLQVLSELEDALGVAIEQKVAVAVRIRQALSRDYNIDLDRRAAHLIRNLDTESAPSRSPDGHEDSPQMNLRSSFPPSEGTQHQAAVEPPPAADFSLRPSTPARGLRSRPRHFGPYSAAQAATDVRLAQQRDDVVYSFFDFAAQYFDYTALFVVHGDLAEGWDAHGPGADRQQISTIGVPLDLPSALAMARDSGTWQLVRLGSSTMDEALARDLSRRPEGLVFVLPITVRARCVMLLYGDHGDADVDPSKLDAVIALASDVAEALERILVQRKRSTLSLGPTQGRASSEAQVVVRTSTSNVPESSQTFTMAIEPGVLGSSADQALAEGTTGASLDENDSPCLDPTSRQRVDQTADRADAIARTTGGMHTASPQVMDPALRPIRTISIEPSARRDPPGSVGGKEALLLLGNADAPSARSPDSDAAGSLAGEVATPVDSPSSAAMQTTDHDEGNAILLTRRPSRNAPPPAAGDVAPKGSAREAAGPPEPRVIAYSPRTPHPPHVGPKTPLPSVIVDVARDCRALVDRVLEGDRQAADDLVSIGEPAIAAVAGRLPGPVSATGQAQLGDRRASECGLMLEILARIGRPSVPFVAVRAADADPAVRTWATRLLGELPSPEAVRSVVPRLSDKDSEVRLAALSATRMLLAHSETRDRLCGELEELTTAGLSKVHRLAGVRALRELRHAASVPVLLPLLTDQDPGVAQSAHEALVQVASQDFGPRPEPWESWWQQNRGRHRVEWLIDALMHASPDIRRSAGDELKTLTREYFGYYDDLPEDDRAHAQQAYRDWWEDRGRVRFT